jgi:NitT/TauT family transport system permease protein
MADITVNADGTATAASRAGTGRRGSVLMARIFVALAALAIWELIARYLVDPFWTGQPSEIAQRIWSLTLNGDLLLHTRFTVSHAVLGLLLSLIVGIPIGVAFAASRFFAETVEPFFLGLYSIPRIALAPLFILWFGIDSLSKVMMAFSLVVFVVILNTYEGLRGVDRELVDMLRAMRGGRALLLRKVLLPSIVPWIFASIRVGVGLALIGSVVGELLGANRGLGWYVEYSAARIDVIGAFAGLVILMIVGMALNELVKSIERHFLRARAQG